MLTIFNVQSKRKKRIEIILLHLCLYFSPMQANATELTFWGGKDDPHLRTHMVAVLGSDADVSVSTNAKKTSSPELNFLRSYYENARLGSRETLLELYEPVLKLKIRQQFLNAAAIKASFADFAGARVVSIFFWGEFRFALVEHTSASAKDQKNIWVHTFRCVSQACHFYDRPELLQISGLIFNLNAKNNNVIKPISEASDERKKLLLYPSDFKELSREHQNQTYPIELGLKVADEKIAIEANIIFRKFLDAAKGGGEKPSGLQEIFNNKTPSSFPLQDSKGETTSYALDAFLRSFVKDDPWVTNVIFSTSNKTWILIATSKSNRQFLLPLVKEGGSMRIESDPEKSPLWPIFESTAFSRANTAGIRNK